MSSGNAAATPAQLQQALFTAVGISCFHSDAGITEPCCSGLVSSYAPVLLAQRARTASRYRAFSRDFRMSGVYTWDGFLLHWLRAFGSFPEGPSDKFISASVPSVQRTLVSLALLD